MKMFPNIRRLLALAVDESHNHSHIAKADAVDSSARLAQSLQLSDTTLQSHGRRLGPSAGMAVLRLRSIIASGWSLLEPGRYAPFATGVLIVGLLCGCEALRTAVIPEPDPQVIAVDGTLKTAPTEIERFLSYVQGNQHILGMDTRHAAKGLKERYESNLLNLKNTRKLYLANRTDANKSLLLVAKEAVDSDRGVAESHLNGYALQRGQGAPFAPPMNIGPPQGPPSALDTILGRLDGIRAEQASIRAEQVATRAAIGALGKVVWSLTNTNGATNAPPVPGK